MVCDDGLHKSQEALEAGGVPCAAAGSAFHVDVPNPNQPEGSWINVVSSDDPEEVLKSAQDLYGADEQGRINVLTSAEGPNVDQEAHWVDVPRPRGHTQWVNLVSTPDKEEAVRYVTEVLGGDEDGHIQLVTPPPRSETQADPPTQARCPQCKAWITEDGRCNNPRCSRNGERIERPLATRDQILAAQRYASEEIDIPTNEHLTDAESGTCISESDDGAWIQGWVYVEHGELQSQHNDSFIAAARDIYGSDDIEVDDDARVSEADDHVWVSGWFWVSDEDQDAIRQDRQVATTLAALRNLQEMQRDLDGFNLADHPVATDGELEPLSFEEINSLCEEINSGSQGLHDLEGRELATTLAALRELQDAERTWDGFDLSRHPVATDGGRLTPLSIEEIDAFCEGINAGAPTSADAPEDVVIREDELGNVAGVTVTQIRSVKGRINLTSGDVGNIDQVSDTELRSAAFDKMLPHLTAAGAEPATVDFEEIERHGDYAIVTQVRSLNVRTRLTPDSHPDVFQGDVTEQALQGAAFDEMMPHLVDGNIEPITLDFQEIDVDFQQ